MHDSNVTSADNTFVYEETEVSKMYFILKRLADIFFAIIGCLMLIPLTIIIKLCCVLKGDFSPIIFKQDRIGKNGKTIKIYKYRSMVVGADQILKDLIENDPDIAEEYKSNKKLKQKYNFTEEYYYGTCNWYYFRLLRTRRRYLYGYRRCRPRYW